MGQICLHSTLGPIDATRQAADEIPRDVLAGTNAAAGIFAMFFGDEEPFHSLSIDVGQAGIEGSLDWFYWSGASWELLAFEEGEFATEGWQTVDFQAPSDWAARALRPESGGGTFYFACSSTGDGYTIPPILDQVVVED